MFSFKRSLTALVGLLVIVGALATLMPLVSRGQGGNPLTKDPRKSYYLTQTTHMGNQALTACASGYHMASLWEIFDTSNVRYNTVVGLTQVPIQASARLLTPAGFAQELWLSAPSRPGLGNCFAWMSPAAWMQGLLLPLLQRDSPRESTPALG